MSDVRRRILEASAELVAERGGRAVSFREVARRAGISHQTPYHHFGNHHGILRALAVEGFEGLSAAMEAAADGLDALGAAGVAYVRFARDHVGHTRVMFDRALVTLFAAEDPVVEAARTYDVLMGLALRAHLHGYGADFDPATLAHLCWSTVHGLAVLMVEGILERKSTGVDEDTMAGDVIQALTTLFRSRAASSR